MPLFGVLARASFAVLCLSAQTQALVASDLRPVHVICDDTRLAAMCDELALALRAAQDRRAVTVIAPADAGGDAHLTLRFQTARFTASLLSGQLSWRNHEGGTGAGPAIDLTVMDATIGDSMLRDYARQLLGLTDLPL